MTAGDAGLEASGCEVDACADEVAGGAGGDADLVVAVPLVVDAETVANRQL